MQFGGRGNCCRALIRTRTQLRNVVTRVHIRVTERSRDRSISSRLLSGGVLFDFLGQGSRDYTMRTLQKSLVQVNFGRSVIFYTTECEPVYTPDGSSKVALFFGREFFRAFLTSGFVLSGTYINSLVVLPSISSCEKISLQNRAMDVNH